MYFLISGLKGLSHTSSKSITCHLTCFCQQRASILGQTEDIRSQANARDVEEMLLRRACQNRSIWEGRAVGIRPQKVVRQDRLHGTDLREHQWGRHCHGGIPQHLRAGTESCHRRPQTHRGCSTTGGWTGQASGKCESLKSVAAIRCLMYFFQVYSQHCSLARQATRLETGTKEPQTGESSRTKLKAGAHGATLHTILHAIDIQWFGHTHTTGNI